jgi:hypothetical protein
MADERLPVRTAARVLWVTDITEHRRAHGVGPGEGGVAT